MTDREHELTRINRKLVLDLNDARNLLRRLIDPEDLGHSVSQEVRAEASKLLRADLAVEDDGSPSAAP